MKKFAVLLGLVGMLMLAASMAQAQSQWAFYKENPVGWCEVYYDDGKLTYDYYECIYNNRDSYKGPQLWLYEDENGEPLDGEPLECGEFDYFLDCCACHGPYAPGNHGGPQGLQCPEPEDNGD